MLPLLTAGATLVGGALANSANAREARRNREFQAHMSGTAYQRAVADMRRAGLNPAMMYPGGSGASTPSGSKAEYGDVVSGAVSSAMQARRLSAELKLLDEQAKNVNQDRQLKYNQMRESGARATNENYRSKMLETELRAMKSGARLSEFSEVGARNLRNFEEGMGTANPMLRQLLEVLRSLSGYQRPAPAR